MDEDELRKQDPFHQTPEEVERFRKIWEDLFPPKVPSGDKIPIGVPIDDENGDQHGVE